MRRHFTADLHFDMPSYLNRPFSSMEEHDAKLISEINRVVDRDDRLYILGDVCMSPRFCHFRTLMNCRDIVLIRGNHDRAHFDKCVSRAEDALSVSIPFDESRHAKVWLSHYPACYWPGSHRGSMHLYGHCHAKREETLDLVFPKRLSMDCGMDNAYRLLGEFRPFSEDEVAKLLWHNPAKLGGHDDIEFYRGKYK